MTTVRSTGRSKELSTARLWLAAAGLGLAMSLVFMPGQVSAGGSDTKTERGTKGGSNA